MTIMTRNSVAKLPLIQFDTIKLVDWLFRPSDNCNCKNVKEKYGSDPRNPDGRRSRSDKKWEH